MKNLLLLVACVFLFASAVNAQQNTPGYDTFRIGSQTIRVPSPDGFVNGYPRISELAGHMKALEDPEGRTLTVHLPHAVAAKIERGEAVERLDFYTTLAVRKDMNNIDVTPAMFAELVSGIESNFETMIDSEMPKAVEAGKKGLSERWGRAADVGLSRPINFGFIDQQPNVSSVMMMTSILNGPQHVLMLGVMSHVVVKKRLLYINIYKEFTADEDAAVLRDFTKNWTAAIIAANK